MWTDAELDVCKESFWCLEYSTWHGEPIEDGYDLTSVQAMILF